MQPSPTQYYPQQYHPYNYYPQIGNTNRREEDLGWHFEPAEVMSDAKHVATMTRGMADLIDTRGQDVISLFNEYSSSGKIN